jgi:cytochrome P450/CRP-like cAMP-binding protein
MTPPAPASAIPKVPGFPVIGNSRSFYHDAPRLFVDSYHRYGPVCRMSIFGADNVVLSGMDANRFYIENEAAHFTATQTYKPMTTELSSDQVMNAMEGEAHRHLRKELGPGFSRQLIIHAVPDMVRYALDEARSWAPGTEFDALSTMSRLLVHQASSALLAVKFTPEQHRDVAKFVDIFVAVGVSIMPKALYWLPVYQRAKKLFINAVGNVVKAERGRQQVSGCPVNLLRVAIQRRRLSGEEFSDNDAIAFASFPLVMNAVYTNRLCAYLLYELLRHPDVLARVQAEVDAVVAGGDWTMAALQRMSVLRAAILETLRLYPLIVALPRHATTDFEFGGYRIPKGQKVIIAMSVTALLPEYFPDPYKWDVDRMLPPRSEQRQPKAFNQYGIGVHRCLGLNVAEILALTVITGLLGAASLEPADPRYLAKRISNPLPGPEGFKIRVRKHRTPVAPVSDAAVWRESEDAILLQASQGLSKDVLARVMAQVRPRTVTPGEPVYREGESADAFYTLLSGQVRLVAGGGGATAGAETVLVNQGCFGDAGLLDRSPRDDSAFAAGDEPLELLVIDQDAFHEIVGSLDLTAPEIAALVRHRVIVGGLAAALPQLQARQLAEFAPRAYTIEMPPSTVIIRQGDAADRFFILLKGRVEVVAEYPGRPDVSLAWLEPGQYFGEIGLLENRPRTATVRSGEEEATVVALDRDAFFALMRESKDSETAIAQHAAQRLIKLAEPATAAAAANTAPA